MPNPLTSFAAAALAALALLAGACGDDDGAGVREIGTEDGSATGSGSGSGSATGSGSGTVPAASPS